MFLAERIYKYCRNTRFGRIDKTLIGINIIFFILLSYILHDTIYTQPTVAAAHSLSRKSLSLTPRIPTPHNSITPTPTASKNLLIHQPTSVFSPTTQPTPTPTTSLTNTPEAPTSTPQPPPVQIAQSTNTPSSSNYLTALNTYRQKKGASPLSWDSTLGNFAQGRADLFAASGGMDNHAGFQSMMNDNGFEKMGFNALGENSSWSDNTDAMYIVETLYAGHGPHDQNQLSAEWTHVGVGINGKATDFVFGGKKR